MPKFKFTFPAELKPTMEKVMQNEKNVFDQMRKQKGARGFAMKLMKRTLKKSGLDLDLKMDYEFISDTEAIVEITTSMDSEIKPEAILKRLKGYEKDSEGKVKVELIK